MEIIREISDNPNWKKRTETKNITIQIPLICVELLYVKLHTL